MDDATVDTAEMVLGFARETAAAIGLKADITLQRWPGHHTIVTIRVKGKTDAWCPVANNHLETYEADLVARAVVQRDIRACLEGLLQVKDVDRKSVVALARQAVWLCGLQESDVNMLERVGEVEKGIWRIQLHPLKGPIVETEVQIHPDDTISEVRNRIADQLRKSVAEPE